MRKSTEFIVIHCSATPPAMDVGAREIDRWHRSKGWFKIGYHFVVRRDGTVEHGRELNEVGAHAIGYNERSVGICLIGGVNGANKPENNFTEAQWKALEPLVSELEEQFPQAKVVGHYELNPGRDCPSFNVQKWMQSRKKSQTAPLIEQSNPNPPQDTYRPLVYSVLREGAKGPLVRSLQAKLNRFYKIEVDGIFGPQTKRAVLAFQARHKLLADGVVGPNTWSALLRYE